MTKGVDVVTVSSGVSFGLEGKGGSTLLLRGGRGVHSRLRLTLRVRR